MDPIYQHVCVTLESFFEALMIELNQPIIDVRSRIKKPESVKEKILRNKLYKKYSKPQELLNSLPDVVGVMIFCRFIHEEETILNQIKKIFSQRAEDGWYYCPDLENTPIHLDLSAKQPQKQKNGFNIYRVDGYYYSYGEKVNFELQIKSLVHSFWSDIEHEIIYKNNSYLIIDSFMKDMLVSIHRNMESMDNQLALIYNQLHAENEEKEIKSKDFTKMLLAKAINDIFINKMYKNIGFTFDFRKACDIISQYVFLKNEIVDNNMSNEKLVELLEKVSAIQNAEIDFEVPITFETKFIPKSRFGEVLGDKLLSIINKDFEWNIFFKILFEIESGNRVEDFRMFLYIIKMRYSDANLYEKLFAKYDRTDAYYIKDEILVTVARALSEDASIKIIYEETFEAICLLLKKLVDTIYLNVNDMNDWEDKKTAWKDDLKEDILLALR